VEKIKKRSNYLHFQIVRHIVQLLKLNPQNQCLEGDGEQEMV